MPLEERSEEQGKSDLKWVEAASRGCAAIASPALYAATVRDGVTGMIAANPAEFRACLARRAADRAVCARLAQAARSEVAGARMLGPQVTVRERWYRTLLARRADLCAPALARG